MGDLRVAHGAAQALLRRSLNAGESAYLGAGYDIALAYSVLGQVLSLSGAAQTSLDSLAEAQRRFQILADAGNNSATHMVSVVISRQGDCLRDLSRLEEAAEAYNQAITRADQHSAKKAVVQMKVQLGAVRALQQRYAEALEIYADARELFASLGDLISVAVLWHNTGIVYKEQGHFDAAEHAYRKSLAIRVQQHDRAGEADSLGELGNLYNKIERWEEAETFYRQAADMRFQLSDLNAEGRHRSNLAIPLIKLQRYDEAREELQRAVECKQPFRHAAEPWKTWEIFYDLEIAVGDTQAAMAAQQQAVDAYLAYRRDGGEPQHALGQVCEMVTHAIQQEEITKVEQELVKYDGADLPASVKLFLAKLRAILNGDRNPALADDPELNYADAAEVRLLLERVGKQAKG